MEQIDTSSVSGRFLVNILLSMSEMERYNSPDYQWKKSGSMIKKEYVVGFLMDIRKKWTYYG